MGKNNLLAEWINAARPRTLVAGIVPVLIAWALETTSPQAQLWRAAGCLVVAIALQIAVNFANDADDAQTGADNADRKGPKRAVASGAIPLWHMRVATLLMLIIAAAAGAWIIPWGRTELWVLGAVSMVAALTYTGMKVAYGYKGWGEAVCGMFFGPVALMGTQAVISPQISAEGLFLGVACGAMAIAILEVNNIRDIPTDRVAKKMTLAARYGKKLGLGIYMGALLTALVATAIIASAKHWVFTAVALILVIGGRLVARLARADKAGEYNNLLRDTALLQLLWGVAVIIGILL